MQKLESVKKRKWCLLRRRCQRARQLNEKKKTTLQMSISNVKKSSVHLEQKKNDRKRASAEGVGRRDDEK